MKKTAFAILAIFMLTPIIVNGVVITSLAPTTSLGRFANDLGKSSSHYLTVCLTSMAPTTSLGSFIKWENSRHLSTSPSVVNKYSFAPECDGEDNDGYNDLLQW